MPNMEQYSSGSGCVPPSIEDVFLGLDLDERLVINEDKFVDDTDDVEDVSDRIVNDVGDNGEIASKSKLQTGNTSKFTKSHSSDHRDVFEFVAKEHGEEARVSLEKQVHAILDSQAYSFDINHSVTGERMIKVT